jgi:hypothetical protein
MKAITLRPYWAWAVCHAGKRVENRTWATRHRGPLAIHAGQGKPASDAADRAALEALGIATPEPAELVRGAVVAVAELVDSLSIEDAKTSGAIFGELAIIPASDKFAAGPYCWVLENVELLNMPVDAIGKLGFFNVDLENPANPLTLK